MELVLMKMNLPHLGWVLITVFDFIHSHIEELDASLRALSNIILSLLLIAGALVALAFLVCFVWWLLKGEGDMGILPFDVIGGEKTRFDGKILSDHLTAELLRIQQIHDAEYESIPHKMAVGINVPQITLKSEDVTYKLSELGPLLIGNISIPLGSLISVLKQLLPADRRRRVFTGSVQRYGSMISVVVHDNIRAWDERCNADEDLPALLRNLSFKIAYDLSKDTKAKSWQFFENYTEALTAYGEYGRTEDDNFLDRSYAECLNAVKREPRNELLPPLLSALGLAFSNKKKYREAKNLFHKAIEIKPDFTAALVGHGVTHYMDGKQLTKALRCFERASYFNPEVAETWSNKGLVLSDLGRHEDALEAYNEAIKLKPERAEIWYNKGLVLSRLGRREDALKAYNEAIQLKPEYTNAWSNKGCVLSELGRHEDALEAYDEAIRLKPEYANVSWSNKGLVLSELGRHEDALKAYDEAIKLKPEDAEVWYNKGLVLSELGRHEDSLEAYNEAIKLKLEYAEAWNNKGLVLSELGRHEDSLEAYNEAIKLKPGYAEIWFNKGNSLFSLGGYEDSLEAYDESIKLKPEYAEVWHNKGLVLNKMGRSDEALRDFAKARELGWKEDSP